MKRQCHPVSNLALMLIAALFFGGCGDQLLPPADGAGNSKAITLKGNLQLETALPDDAKVVLLWEVMHNGRHDDTLFAFGEGSIDRANNTFEIKLNGAPSSQAMNWISQARDSGFAVGIIAIVPDSIQEGYLSYGPNGMDMIYGAVNQTALWYFSQNPFWWRYDDPCSKWLETFKQGYQVVTGVGLKSKESLGECGITPVSSSGLTMVVNTDINRFRFVEWY